LEAWGIMHTGSEWWHFTHGRYTPFADVAAPPWCLRVSSFRPGQVIASVGVLDCFVLEDGEIYQPGGPIVAEATGPVSDFFSHGRRALTEAVSVELGDWPNYDTELRNTYDHILMRLLSQVQQRGHGGAFVFFKEPAMDRELESQLKPKFRVNLTSPWE